MPEHGKHKEPPYKSPCTAVLCLLNMKLFHSPPQRGFADSQTLRRPFPASSLLRQNSEDFTGLPAFCQFLRLLFFPRELRGRKPRRIQLCQKAADLQLVNAVAVCCQHHSVEKGAQLKEVPRPGILPQKPLRACGKLVVSPILIKGLLDSLADKIIQILRPAAKRRNLQNQPGQQIIQLRL